MVRAFTCLASLSAILLTLSLSAAEWRNLDNEHRVCGRKVSAGYLTGKVVLVCRDAEYAEFVEELWDSFKSKPFVALGAFSNAVENVTYPVYAGGGLAHDEPTHPLYIVGYTGNVYFRNTSKQRVSEALVNAITDLGSPRSAKQWWKYIGYDFTNQPAHAVIRLRDYRKAFPKDDDERLKTMEAELAKLPQIDRLVELVAFAEKAKDHRGFDAKKLEQQREKVLSLIETANTKYADLKESADPRLAQEAKNALAEMAWTKSTL